MFVDSLCTMGLPFGVVIANKRKEKKMKKSYELKNELTARQQYVHDLRKIRKEIDRLNAQNVVRSSMPQVVKDVIDGKYTRVTK